MYVNSKILFQGDISGSFLKLRYPNKWNISNHVVFRRRQKMNMRHLLMPVENGYFSKTFLFLFGIVIRQDVVNNDSPQRPLFLYLQVIFDSLSTLFVSALSFIHMNSLCRLLTVFLCLSLLSDLRFSSNEILDNPIAGFSSSLRKLVSIYINIGR